MITAIISFVLILFIHNSLVTLNKNIKKNTIELNNVLKNDTGIYYYAY